MDPVKAARGILGSIGRIGDPPRQWPQNLYSLEVADTSEFMPLTEPSSFRLTEQQKRFADTMAFFVNQARRQRRAEAFLGQCYGRLLAKWPEPRSALLAWNQSQRKEFFRLQLLQTHRLYYLIEPTSDWETILSLPTIDYLLVSDALLQLGDELRGTINDRFRPRIDALHAALVLISPDGMLDNGPMDQTDNDTGEDASENEVESSIAGDDDGMSEDNGEDSGDENNSGMSEAGMSEDDEENAGDDSDGGMSEDGEENAGDDNGGGMSEDDEENAGDNNDGGIPHEVIEISDDSDA
ncbi:hypothetical protein EST38_g13256 [Candolleomyces aberdarensis]|uniref:Uncharacterized protein n=1 Tax=Candolleomyces aberdarensis TaxID=2316362 RepID=A0A4Q2D0E0_9AGAR|nr:hypothetical protein EST38_g13256 [Candolleomyces aberdarensis]